MRGIAQRCIVIAVTTAFAMVIAGCRGDGSRGSTRAVAAPTGPTTAPAADARKPGWPDDELLEQAFRRLFAEHPAHAGKLIFVGVSFGDQNDRQQDPPEAVLTRLKELHLRLRPRSTAVQPRTKEQASEGWYHDPATGEVGLGYFVDVTHLSDDEWLLDLGWTPGLLGGRAEQYRATRQPSGAWTLTPTGRVSVF